MARILHRTIEQIASSENGQNDQRIRKADRSGRPDGINEDGCGNRHMHQVNRIAPQAGPFENRHGAVRARHRIFRGPARRTTATAKILSVMGAPTGLWNCKYTGGDTQTQKVWRHVQIDLPKAAMRLRAWSSLVPPRIHPRSQQGSPRMQVKATPCS